VLVSVIQLCVSLGCNQQRGDEWMFSECVADRRAQFEKLEYTELDYQEELEHIEQVCVDSCSNLDSYLASFLARQ
jgi:hypothetical protein